MKEGPYDALGSPRLRVGAGVDLIPSSLGPLPSPDAQLADLMNPNELPIHTHDIIGARLDHQNPNRFTFLAHVDPPPDEERVTVVLPSMENVVTVAPGLFYYIGPRHFPAGIYMPKGYDLESRPGEDGWTVLRARCLATGQVMTMWAVGPSDGEHSVVEPDLMEDA